MSVGDSGRGEIISRLYDVACSLKSSQKLKRIGNRRLSEVLTPKTSRIRSISGGNPMGFNSSQMLRLNHVRVASLKDYLVKRKVDA